MSSLRTMLFESADRYAPERSGWRLILGVVLTVPGVVIGLIGLYGLLVTTFGSGYEFFVAGIPMVLFGAMGSVVGWDLAADALADGNEPSTTDVGDETDVDEAIATLRTRYAEGKIDDATFERKVHYLLATDESSRSDSVVPEIDGDIGETRSEQVSAVEFESELAE